MKIKELENKLENHESNNADPTQLELQKIKSSLKSWYWIIPISSINSWKDIPNIRLWLYNSRVYIYRTDKKEKDIFNRDTEVLVWRINIDDKCEPTGFEIVSHDLIEETFTSLDGNAYFKNINNKYVKPNMKNISNRISWNLKENLLLNEDQLKFVMKDAYLSERNRIHIQQWKYWIISWDSDWRFIETTWLWPCIGICLWNTKTHDAWIIHIDTDETYQLLPKLFEKIQWKDKDYIEVNIIWWWISWYDYLDEQHTKPLINKCRKFFEDRWMKIKTYDVLNEEIIDLVALDKESGNLLIEKSNEKISELRGNTNQA